MKTLSVYVFIVYKPIRSKKTHKGVVNSSMCIYRLGDWNMNIDGTFPVDLQERGVSKC